MELSETDVKRFWRKVDRSGDCWLWTDVLAANGYGYLGIGGRSGRKIQAHRIAFELAKGPIPEGMQIDHLCRNRGCVNPDHLESVTQRENLLRGTGVSARHAVATHCSRGHEFNDQNTRTRNGKRQCKICQNYTKRMKRIEQRGDT